MNFDATGQSSPSDETDSTQRFSDDLLAQDQHGLDAEEREAIEALPSASALLIVQRGPNEGARFLLDQDVTTVGRHPNADIFLDDVTVSRRHAEFRRTGTSFMIHDLASLNGTYFDGVRIESALLDEGAEVQIGKFKFTFFASRADLGA
ncbi:MAG: FHA domain-containing protein [Rhodoluna sp.]|nr:FHA domain-containing protein [Rhodoluna sp.]MBP6186508.1 FHA domain-containing protein [Rhodoluna sp.]